MSLDATNTAILAEKGYRDTDKEIPDGEGSYWVDQNGTEFYLDEEGYRVYIDPEDGAEYILENGQPVYFEDLPDTLAEEDFEEQLQEPKEELPAPPMTETSALEETKEQTPAPEQPKEQTPETAPSMFTKMYISDNTNKFRIMVSPDDILNAFQTGDLSLDPVNCKRVKIQFEIEFMPYMNLRRDKTLTFGANSAYDIITTTKTEFVERNENDNKIIANGGRRPSDMPINKQRIANTHKVHVEWSTDKNEPKVAPRQRNFKPRNHNRGQNQDTSKPNPRPQRRNNFEGQQNDGKPNYNSRRNFKPNQPRRDEQEQNEQQNARPHYHQRQGGYRNNRTTQPNQTNQPTQPIDNHESRPHPANQTGYPQRRNNQRGGRRPNYQ